MKKTAVISEDGLYRYRLTRSWDSTLEPLTIVMLNPSKADAEYDDPTIRRCIGYAKSLGFGGILVVNLFAYRATNPTELFTTTDPIGGQNAEYLGDALQNADYVLLAYGNSGIVKKLLYKFPRYKPLELAQKGTLHYLELSKDGTPKHPLYLKKDLTLTRFEIGSFKKIM